MYCDILTLLSTDGVVSCVVHHVHFSVEWAFRSVRVSVKGTSGKKWEDDAKAEDVQEPRDGSLREAASSPVVLSPQCTAGSGNSGDGVFFKGLDFLRLFE